MTRGRKMGRRISDSRYLRFFSFFLFAEREGKKSGRGNRIGVVIRAKLCLLGRRGTESEGREGKEEEEERKRGFSR